MTAKHRKTTAADGGVHSDAYRRRRAKYRAKCEKFGVVCHLCGQKIDYNAPAADPNSFELDHFYPRSTHPHLGMDEANWRPSHSDCNRSRGNEDVRPTLGTPSEAW